MVAQTTELCIVKGYREYCFPSGRNDQEDQEEMFQAEEKAFVWDPGQAERENS